MTVCITCSMQDDFPLNAPIVGFVPLAGGAQVALCITHMLCYLNDHAAAEFHDNGARIAEGWASRWPERSPAI